ncbi:MAG: SusC/RagA family TonB-linked outer membrane protein [Chitinophagaceae bacterium]|nr:SusC/RagA family TonB-linked outer membrane protein [Chitinophagaceae bacterium]
MSAKTLLSAIFCIIFVFVLQLANAQDRTVSGKVTDAKDGTPVVGASVVAKGTTVGTSTNNNGMFSLNVSSSVNTLVVTSVGYDAYEVSITGQSSVDISLTPQAGGLSEVVVIGYGTTRKRDLTGAVTSVQARDFNKGNYTAPDQLIQGKVAGVQVLNNTGAPGGGTTVKIRGNSALTGSGQPLYVVDGVPLDGRSSRPGLDAQNLGVTPGGNPLNFINPADIASIDVLKDASATAIYGSRAAYGVVIITTKKGQSGQPKIDFGASVGVSKLMRQIEILDPAQYREAIVYYGVNAANDLGGNEDAMDAILQTALQQNYNVSVSAGTDAARYRFSAGVLDQEGIVRKTGFRKYTANFNAGFKFLDSKKLGLDFNILPSHYSEKIAPVSNTAGASGSLIGQALQWNPTEGLRKPDGTLNIKAGTTINPLAMSEAYNDKSKVTTVLASVSPYFKFTNSLEYRFLYSINYSTGMRRTSIQQYINLPDISGKGWAAIGDNELITQQFTHTLNFNKKLTTDLNLKALAGFEYMKFDNKGSTIRAYGPAIPGGFGSYGLDYTNYIQYSNASGRTITSFVDPTTELQSYFARAEFNFKDKYLVTGTFRADGSTKFGENNRYGYFPSFAAAWIITKEDFFKVDFINMLKLRGGWGITGNQEFPAGAAQARYTFRDNGGLGLSNNPNPDLKWQSDRQFNIGLDFDVARGKVSGSVDYFNKTTTDLLFPSAPIQPAPPGTVVRWINLDGEIENSGVEIVLNTSIISKTDFTWDFSVNATFIENKVSGLNAPIYTGGLHGQGVSGTLVQTIQNGLPINAFFTREFLEMDKATGLAVYRDGGSSFYYVGNPNPKTLLGISTSVMYKKLGLTINMNGAFGQDIYNNTLNNVINVGSINGGRNIALSVFRDPTKESFANPVTSSSRFIEKGSYLKMANATLSYNIGTLAKVFKGANIYLTGQNLFVITDFTGFDPEVNVDKNNNGIPSVGIEYTPYPSARTFILGVNFSL